MEEVKIKYECLESVYKRLDNLDRIINLLVKEATENGWVIE